MQPDGYALVWDAQRASRLVRDFAEGRSFDDYRDDVMFRSAVERQLQIIGEALSRLSRVDPETAATLPELRSIVGFRNILVHGYAQVDDEVVWRIIHDDLPLLERNLTGLLE